MKTKTISKFFVLLIILILGTSEYLFSQLEKIEVENGFVEGALYVKNGILYSDRLTVKFNDCICDLRNGEKYALCQNIEEMVKKVLEYKREGKHREDAEYLERKIDELVEKIYLESVRKL